MANQVEKFNTIAITDIDKVNGLGDDAIDKLNGLTFAGTVQNTWQGTHAVIFGGYEGSGWLDTIGYIAISTGGSGAADTTYDLIAAGANSLPCSTGGGGRTVQCGGYGPESTDGQSSFYKDTMQYFTNNNSADAVDWGYDWITSGYGMSQMTNGTVGVWAGGREGATGSTFETDIFRVTLSGTPAAGSDVGNLDKPRFGGTGLSNGTTGIIGAAYTKNGSWSWIDDVVSITIADGTSVSSFGNLISTTERGGAHAAEDDSRGVYAGGYTSSSDWTDDVQYFTIASASDATAGTDLAYGDTNGGDGCANLGTMIMNPRISSSGYTNDDFAYLNISSTANGTAVITQGFDARASGMASGN